MKYLLFLFLIFSPSKAFTNQIINPSNDIPPQYVEAYGEFHQKYMCTYKFEHEYVRLRAISNMNRDALAKCYANGFENRPELIEGNCEQVSYLDVCMYECEGLYLCK